MKILVTGFDPFGGEPINPAFEIVKKLPKTVAGVEIVTQEIPTVFGKSIKTATDAIARENPDAVLLIGQAGGRFELCIEKVAINFDHARIKDNDGNQPFNAPIYPDAPTAYFTGLPVHAIVQAMQDVNCPARVSYSAGTFVCNHLMYGVLHYLAAHKPSCLAGFMHIPFLPEQVLNKKNTPSLDLESDVRGITAALATISKFLRGEIKETEGSSGGTLH